jgi:hypothetical protein
VRALIDRLIVSRRSLLESTSRLDAALRGLGALLDLRQDLDRNINPDLILERLLADLRRASPEVAGGVSGSGKGSTFPGGEPNHPS